MFRKSLILFILFALALAGCTALSNLSGGVTAEETETQGVIVEGVPALIVNHFAGTIDIQTGEAGQITANLTKQSHLNDETEAEAQLEEIVMSFSQSGPNVTLNVEGPDTVTELASGPTAELELLVPPGTSLDLNLGAGEIAIDQPAGDVMVNSGAGEATVVLPANASFRLVVTGGAAGVNSEFEGVPAGGVAVDIDTNIGDNPTQTLMFNVGAGEINLQKAP